MSISKTLGGDRLGSGKKQKIELRGYERSTHDLSYLFRTTMSSGTLVPFMKLLALPGDTKDIRLDCDVKTHPTVGPLFGSYKVQLDTFTTPIRLYNSLLHNNKLKIGLEMEKVKLPVIKLTATQKSTGTTDIDNYQVNPSSLLAYMGIRGVGHVAEPDIQREFQAVPIIAYWDIYKNYYANKQEEIGAVIHTPSVAIVATVLDVAVNGNTINQRPATSIWPVSNGDQIEIQYTGGTPPLPEQIMIDTSIGMYSAKELCGGFNDDGVAELTGTINTTRFGTGWSLYSWDYRTGSDINTGQPKVQTFPLSRIDEMREAILSYNVTNVPFVINTNAALEPYKWLYEQPNGVPNVLSSQEGLALKTYQSDLFNNWIQTEWIDGTDGINEVTKIDVTSGFLKIDQLILARKVYDVLNRVAVSGGTYKDWLDVRYDHVMPWIPESPIYMGGLSKELVFQEVVSNSQTESQPLGTLAGRGTMGNKHKGGNITIKVDEPSYIIGIVSLTPRIDYSQGNDWDVYSVMTMNDLHAPGLDEIGFQELITEQMHWASTEWDTVNNVWVQKSAGKQPAWTNYMTAVNKVYGNFAIQNNEMFMTLNRRYEIDETTNEIKDLTTYIDPVKYNQIFAETALDAQNFWTQISVDITSRRKMSAKVMPNL